MLPNPLETLIKTASVLGSPSFSPKDLEEFPYSDWIELTKKYEKWESWFNGDALAITQTQGERAIDTYPMRINPIRTSALKHAYALFGEFTDDITGTLVQPKVVVDSKRDKQQSDAVEDALSKVWYENNGSALMFDNGIVSQVFGGCIFKVSWVPESQFKLRLENIHPKEFIGIPYDNNHWKLRKAWVIRKITADTALEYGYETSSNYAYYIEFWKEDEYQILINDHPITIQYADTMHILGGDNPFGFVPFVYIPHERTGDFYGNSIVTDAAIGLTKELNLRSADAGDASSQQTHSIIAVRNTKGTPELRKFSNGMPYVFLGSSQNIQSSTQQPDMFSVSASQVTDPLMRLTSTLRDELRRELFVPAVAEGEDEGSQRSAATLVLRMWPLTSHIKSERALWSTGLNLLHRMILRILAKKKYLNIKDEHLEIPLKSKWAPILPRDRQAFVEELVARQGVNLGSLQHLLGLIGDVDDIDLVVQQIKEWLEFESSLAPKNTFGGTNGSQSNSGGPQEA